MNEDIHIIAFPTTRCNVDCRHCIDRAGPTGIDLPISYASKLAAKLVGEQLTATLCLTGYGDPLMHDDLCWLTAILGATDQILGISLQTAGYTDLETAKRQRLLRLLKEADSDRFELVMSYNLYADFNARLTSFLADLIDMPHEMLLNVKLCVSRDNHRQTVSEFSNLLVNFAELFGLAPVGECGIDPDYNRRRNPKHLQSRRYLLHGRHADHKLRTIYHSLSKAGKARTIPERPWYRHTCDCFDRNPAASVVLFPDGHFYPCERSIGCKRRQLGHIEHTPLREVLARKKRLVQTAHWLFTPIELFFNATPCTLCKCLPI